MDERVSSRSHARAKRPLPARLAASLQRSQSVDSLRGASARGALPWGVNRFQNGMLRVLALARAVLAEPECARLRTLIEDAERCYAPGARQQLGTASPFTWWAYFDFYAGPRRHSLGELLIDVERELDPHSELAALLERAQASRLGLFVHEGYADDGVMLRELVVDREPRVRRLTGSYSGQPDELWLARVIQLPGDGSGSELVATTPYVITEPGERHWRDFLAEVLDSRSPAEHPEAYARLMKRGLHRYFWNDFASSSQVSQIDGAIFLAGLPLVARTAHTAARRPV